MPDKADLGFKSREITLRHFSADHIFPNRVAWAAMCEGNSFLNIFRLQKLKELAGFFVQQAHLHFKRSAGFIIESPQVNKPHHGSIMIAQQASQIRQRFKDFYTFVGLGSIPHHIP